MILNSKKLKNHQASSIKPESSSGPEARPLPGAGGGTVNFLL